MIYIPLSLSVYRLLLASFTTPLPSSVYTVCLLPFWSVGAKFILFTFRDSPDSRFVSCKVFPFLAYPLPVSPSSTSSPLCLTLALYPQQTHWSAIQFYSETDPSDTDSQSRLCSRSLFRCGRKRELFSNEHSSLPRDGSISPSQTVHSSK